MITAALSHDACQVLQAGRSALRASEADRDRIERALRERLGSGALPFNAVVSSRKIGIRRFAFGAVIGACFAGSAIVFTARSRPSVPPETTRVQARPQAANLATPLSSRVGPAALGPQATTTQTPLPATVALAMPHAPTAIAQQDPLTLEVALLSRATSAISMGHLVEALKELNEHRRRFPNGILSEERSIALARVLCALGRVEEGRAELSHLTPESPAASGAVQVCDAVSTLDEPLKH